MASILGIRLGKTYPSTERYETTDKRLREDLKRFHDLEQSDLLKRYQELDALVNSGDFEHKVKKLKTEKFKHTDAYKSFVKYKESKKSANVKRYYKLLKKAKDEKAEELKTTQEIQIHLQLKAFVESDEFMKIKAHMNDKKRFKKSEQFRLQEEYKNLHKDEDIKWFFKTKNANPFEELDKWQLTFEDDFNSPHLDKNKWITGYYWGKALLNDSYVQSNEKQFFTEKNIELKDSCAHLITRKEAIDGKVWNPERGFLPQKFEFTSGLISTGQSFRQQYGLFEAKIKYHHTTPLNHSFWLLAEKLAPQVNILKTNAKNTKKFEVGHYWNKGKEISQWNEQIKGPGKNGEFYIYSLEWSTHKMEWKINGHTIAVQTDNIPQEPMYIILSTNFTDDPKIDKLPLNMEVDWVRCFQKN